MILENSFRMTHYLCKEQLLILQNNLDFNDFEIFMSYFSDNSEKIPEEKDKREIFIINVMKKHEFWGEIYGWGKTRVYKKLPKKSIHSLSGPYNIFSLFEGDSKKDLIIFLNNFRPFISPAFNPDECYPVEK